MPKERDFRRSPEAGAKKRDFTRTADEATDKALAPVDSITFNIGTPEFEEALKRTRDSLRADGYSDDVIDNLTLPHGIAKPLPDHVIGELYNSMLPTLESNTSAIEETWKIAQQLLDEDGMAVSPFDWSLMRNLIGIYAREDLNLGGKGMAGMAEARSWWKKLQRAAGDRLADTVAEGVMDFQLGLSLLDVFSFINKKFKMQFVPEDQRAELEARVLPKIVLDDGREFRTGTSAALWVLGQRMWGLGEQAVATGMMATPTGLASLLPNSPLNEIQAQTAGKLMEQGKQRERQAFGQIPPLTAALGEHLSWQEVVERNFDDDAVEAMYRQYDENDLYGQIQMGGVAVGFGLADIFLDPLMVFGVAQSKLPVVGRTILSRVAPGKAADITSQIARRTYKMEDALDAVAAARKDLQAAEEAGRAQAAGTNPARMSREAAIKIIQKREALAREQQWLGRFDDPGPHDIIMTRTARRHPEAAPELQKTEEYVDLVRSQHGPVPERPPFPIEEQNALLKEINDLRAMIPGAHSRSVPGLQQRLQKAMDKLGELGTLSEEEGVEVGKLIVERSNLQKLLKNVTGPARAGVQEALRTINRQVDDILEKGRRSFVTFDKVTKTRTVPKDINEVSTELHAMRKKALERDADMPIDWNNVEDLPLFQQRHILGPDDVEQSADALNHMVRTGGTGIDDVAITPTNIEYSIMPQSKVGLINWRLVDLNNDIVKAEREFQLIGKQYDLFTSSRRVVARQIHAARKALGLLRKQKGMVGDLPIIKDKIKVFEKELADLKVSAQKLKGVKDKVKYDDIWLPKVQDTIATSPSRLNKWLQEAGDTTLRSLYPGGFITSRFGLTKAGQIFAPFREPQRFLETYDPDAWDRIRSGYLRYHQHQRAFYDEVLEISELAGIMKRKSKWNPTKEWTEFSIDQKRNQQLFDLLDESPGSEKFTELWEAADDKMRIAHDRIRQILDHAADQQGISGTTKYLTGYIRHVISRDQFAGGARPIEYIGLPTNADVFASHLLGRTGAAGYPRDAMLALDMYGRAMYRKLVLEPLYDDIIQTGADLAAKHNNPVFQTYMNDMVHTLKGKPQFIGKKVDEMLGGAFNSAGKVRWRPNKIDRALGGMTGLMYTGALGANPRYPIMQIATGIATTAGRFGMLRTSRAIWEMATPEGQAINKAIGTYDAFLDIFESDFARRLTNLFTRRAYAITPFGPMSTAMTEEYIRGVTAHAAVDMYMTKFGFSTWTEAKAAGFANRIAFEALRAAEEVNHMFGALGRSPWATRTFAPSKGVAIGATQFLSFIPKQTEELLSQMNRGAGHLVEYFAISGWISRIAAEELGVDLTTYVGLGYMPESISDMTSPAVDVFMRSMDMAESMRKRDPIAVSDAVTQFLSSAQTLIPTIAAFESAGKASQRLVEGEQITLRGEKERELDFLATLPEVEPSDDPRFTGARRFAAGGLEGLARAIRPSAEPGRAAEDPMAGLGGDLIPTIGMQQNIRENVFRRGRAAATREQRRFAFNMRKTIRGYLDAIDDGDFQRQEELEAELANTYKIRITGDDPITRAAQAREISWVLRQIMGNEVLLDRFIKIYADFGMEISP